MYPSRVTPSLASVVGVNVRGAPGGNANARVDSGTHGYGMGST